MDFCRNVTVVAGEYNHHHHHHHHQEQLLAPPPPPPPCSKLGASVDDLFPAQNTEEDVGLEWLSVFVEDCLSSTGNCLPVSPPTCVQNTISDNTTTTKTRRKPTDQKPQQHPSAPLHKFVIPSKARTKRIRRATIARTKANPLTTWSSHFNIHNQNLSLACSPDPPLLQQAYWLADSELIVTKKEETNNSPINDGDSEERKQELKEEEELEVMAAYKENLCGGGGGGGGQQQQPRRCTHCLAQRTPQWRAGPLGPKTLCNACGVRYKSGRLLPEYRPAKSPTFVSYLHSNSHKKVMEMRMALLSSINSQ